MVEYRCYLLERGFKFKEAEEYRLKEYYFIFEVGFGSWIVEVRGGNRGESWFLFFIFVININVLGILI